MYMYLIRAKPTSKSKYARRMAGAFVDCWIDFKDSRAGQRLAEILIEEADWEVLSKRPKFWKFKTLRDVRRKDRPYYREAKQFGSSLVFNMWPIKEPKAKKR